MQANRNTRSERFITAANTAMTDTDNPTATDRLLLASLFPANVAVICAEPWMWQQKLMLAEEALCHGNADKRQREFRAGRHCARAALAQHGHASGPLLRGEKGEPLWPDGYCGTISHSGAFCAAAVGRKPEIVALGMDIERHRNLKDGVLAKIATTAEITRVEMLLGQTGNPHYDVVLFSIKEAIHKAYFPLTRHRLGFHDVDVVMDAGTETFTASILRPATDCVAAPPVLQGRFAVTGAYVCTAIVMAAGEDGGILPRTIGDGINNR